MFPNIDDVDTFWLFWTQSIGHFLFEANPNLYTKSRITTHLARILPLRNPQILSFDPSQRVAAALRGRSKTHFTLKVKGDKGFVNRPKTSQNLLLLVFIHSQLAQQTDSALV